MPQSSPPPGPSAVSARVADSRRIAASAAGLYASVSGLGALLAQHRGGSLAVQAFVAEWGAGRLGVAWSDPDAPILTIPEVVRRIKNGALVGAGAAVGVVLFAGLTGAFRLSRGSVSAVELGLGLVVALFGAMRDELLLRGLTLRAFRHTFGERGQLVVCGCVAAAARVGQLADVPVVTLLTGATGLVSLLIAFLAGTCLGALWLRERGAWMAFAAHAAWSLVSTTMIAGGSVYAATWKDGVWGGGGFDSSACVATGLVGITLGATFVWNRRPTRTS